MVATHVLVEREASGDLSTAHALAGGRASALFAVLAGVTIALTSGARRPVRGRERLGRSAGLVVRALLVAAVGLVLGTLGSGLAVILTYYGLLFLLGIAFLGLSAQRLAALAAGWMVAAPVVSHLVRPHLPARGYSSPSLAQLADPGQLLSELLLTGYYPVLPWGAYLLAGMALGRLDLRGRRVQAQITAVGAVLVIGATQLSRTLTARADVGEALRDDPPTRLPVDELLTQIAGGLGGTTPTDGAWQWLLVVAPHSATPFDLAQTIGSSLSVIGAALLLAGVLPLLGQAFLGVLFGAGTMTLTLYSLHVFMRTPEVWPREQPESFLSHVLVLGGIGLVFAALEWRGPLERLVGSAANVTARVVAGRPG